MPRKTRTSKDEETQPPLTQRPEFIIGMTFLAVVAAFIISVLIFRFIGRRKDARMQRADEAVSKIKDTTVSSGNSYPHDVSNIIEDTTVSSGNSYPHYVSKIIEDTTVRSGSSYPHYREIMTYEGGDQYNIFVKFTLDEAGNEIKETVVKKNYIPDYDFKPEITWGLKTLSFSNTQKRVEHHIKDSKKHI